MFEPPEPPPAPPINPYHHDYGDDVSSAPFAGRADVFGRLYRHLARTGSHGGLCVMGRRHTGKSALLYAIQALFAESTLPVLVRLREIPIDDETTWVLALAQAATAALVEHRLSVSRLSALEPPGADPAAWFQDEFMPALMASLRHPRRLLWLIDDGGEWLHAVRSGALPDDHVARFHALIGVSDDIDLVVTLDADHEDTLAAFTPLIGVTDVVRLSPLTRADAAWLLREPVRGLYALEDDAVEEAHAITGGAPGLLQQIGYLLFRKWSLENRTVTMTRADVKALIATVYAYGERDFIDGWRALSADERLVLTAISSITHSNPAARIDAPVLESWLIETEYPRDVVAINAAMRGLEYRDVVALSPDDGIRINGDCLQLWLIEHARLGDRATRAASSGDRRASDQRRARVDVADRLSARQVQGGQHSAEPNASVRLIVLFGLALVISTAILIASVVSTPRTPSVPPPPPTATLIILPDGASGQ